MLILVRNVVWQAWLKSVWLKKLLYLNCSHAFQLSYLNHSYSSPCPFFCMWLVILNKGKVTHAMILKKEIITEWWNDMYLSLAFVYDGTTQSSLTQPWKWLHEVLRQKNFQWDLHSIMSCRLYFEVIWYY